MTRLFDPTTDEATARVFATPLGVDFCAALVDGLQARLQGQPPEAIARVEIHVANARMQRRLHSLFAARGPGLLPRIRPVAALAEIGYMEGVGAPVSPLRLRLQLAQLVSALLARDPDLAPRAALYDLSDSLADFLAEMCEEQVTPEDLSALDMSEHSRHWERSQSFLNIVARYFREDAALTPEARQSLIVDRLIQRWQSTPPEHPVLVAGSTGSRGTTFRLMQAVARLPQGAVLLPGIDRDMPAEIWRGLVSERASGGLNGEDHPQFRLARVAEAAGIAPWDIPDWAEAMPANVARNRAVSLALRPAPVTDQWRIDGPRLTDLETAFDKVTLLEAPTPQLEAAAIALRLRAAVEKDGMRVALVSPDRRLARQVSAALDRWKILPDDSAGAVLDQTVGGRFLRLLAEARAIGLTAELLVAILTNPMCQSGAERGPHLRFLREFELQVLRGEVRHPDAELLRNWAAEQDDPAAVQWADWIVAALIDGAEVGAQATFATHVAAHLDQAETLARGMGGSPEEAGRLYRGEEGQALSRLGADLRAEGAAGGEMSARDYADLFTGLARDREARQSLRPHARVLIWGTMEARVQGADLIILAGLNEGTWPAAPSADPWLNRALRAEAGLRLPDRVIGLSAHDFQQAMSAPEVWLTRARRDGESETVPSRWINRMSNLLAGASDASKAALDGMKKRGDDWLAQADAMITPPPQMVDAAQNAPRPAPAPPLAARPKRLSVTQIERLIRDPYAIYAREVLRLRMLQPLRRLPDAALRGSALHSVYERFVDETRAGLPPDAAERLGTLAEGVLQEAAPWPATRALWRARLARSTPFFLSTEAERRARAAPWLLEVKGRWQVPGTDFVLSGKVDRIDLIEGGGGAIYDYKSGAPPTAKQERVFTKQLWLEALMLEDGAFEGQGGPKPAVHIAYIGFGSAPAIVAHDPTPQDLADVQAQLQELLTHFAVPEVGYPSRRAVADLRYTLDYDHLARYGEWDESVRPHVFKVGEDAP